MGHLILVKKDKFNLQQCHWNLVEAVEFSVSLGGRLVEF